MFSLRCVWINIWENNRDARDLSRYRAHYDVIVVIVSNNHNLIFLHYDSPKDTDNDLHGDKIIYIAEHHELLWLNDTNFDICRHLYMEETI